MEYTKNTKTHDRKSSRTQKRDILKDRGLLLSLCLRLVPQNSGAVWKSRWPSSAPALTKPTLSADVKQLSAKLSTTPRATEL